MTRRSGLAVVVAVAALVAAAGASTAEDRQATERHVYVSVTDDGSPVADLAATDFVVRENGVAREVLNIAVAPPPSHIGLVVDDSEVTRPMIAELRRGLRALVVAGQQSSPAPAISVMTVGDRPARVVASTANAEALLSAIDRLFSKPGSGALLLDGIVEEAQALQRLNAERPVIIAFSADASAEFSTATRRRVETALRDAGASLWTITVQGAATNPVEDSQERRERAQVVVDVAGATGGVHRNVLSIQGIEDAMTGMVTSIGARYDVTYSRPQSLIPPDELEVEVRRPGVRVAAPRWPGR